MQRACANAGLTPPRETSRQHTPLAHSPRHAAAAIKTRPTRVADGLQVLLVVKLGRVHAHHRHGRAGVLALQEGQVGQDVHAVDAAAGSWRRGRRDGEQVGANTCLPRGLRAPGQQSCAARRRRCQRWCAPPVMPANKHAQLNQSALKTRRAGGRQAGPALAAPPAERPEVEQHHLAAQLPRQLQGGRIQPVQAGRELGHLLHAAALLHVCGRAGGQRGARVVGRGRGQGRRR